MLPSPCTICILGRGAIEPAVDRSTAESCCCMLLLAVPRSVCWPVATVALRHQPPVSLELSQLLLLHADVAASVATGSWRAHTDICRATPSSVAFSNCRPRWIARVNTNDPPLQRSL